MKTQKIVCPWCPLQCDDISVSENGTSTVSCSLAQKQFTSLASQSSARIDGRSITEDELMDVLISSIGVTKSIDVVVASSTFRIARTIARLRSPFRIVTDSSPSQTVMAAAVARCGVISATLADIKNHADLIVEMGSFGEEAPRLAERLQRTDSPTKWIKITPGPDEVAQLMAASKTGTSKTRRPPSVQWNADSNVQQLAAEIDQANYVAFLLARDAFGDHAAVPVAEMFVEYVIGLNDAKRERTQRAVIATLDPLATLKSVFGWHHNQHVADGRTSVEDDSVFRIGLGWHLREPSRRFDLQIGGVDLGPRYSRLFVPTTKSGIHEEDMVIRGDGTVTLPLAKVFAPHALKSASHWMEMCRDLTGEPQSNS